MAKFNLKNYQKINGDEHIDAKLQESHQTAPNEINEVQLETYRATKPDVLTEKQLDKVRGGNKEESEVVEKRLDTNKSKFANKYRNPEAYTGDLNKLEEKRLLNDPVEDEKYKDASETPKKLRWWETAPKSPDGLKLAQKKIAQVRTEELTFKKPRWEEALEEDFSPLEDEGDLAPEEEAIRPIDPSDIKDEFEIEDFSDVDLIPDIEETSESKSPMVIEKVVPITTPTYGIYVVLNYDANDFMGDEQSIKQSALDKVLETKPELSGFISTKDFGGIKEEGSIGTVKLRVLDENLKMVLEPAGESELGGDTLDRASDIQDSFEEISYEEQDVGGTPMAMGRIKVNIDVNDENRDQVIEEAVEFAQNTYPLLNINKDSMDLSKLDKGDLGFLVEIPNASSVDTVDSFPINEVAAQSSVNVKKK